MSSSKLIRYYEALDEELFELLRMVFLKDCTGVYLKPDGSHEVRDYDQQAQSNRGLVVFLQRLDRGLGPETRVVTHHNVMNFQFAARPTRG